MAGKRAFVRGGSLLVLAAAMVAAAPGAAQAQQPAARIAVPPIAYTTRTLPNGLKVYAIRDTGTANVHVQMFYDVGSQDDPAGRSGFAHLFEHILSRVTRNIAPGQLSRIVEEEAGGTRNASTSPDTTRYYETVPANQLEAMLWAHAERMGRSVLDQSVFDAERSIVKEEMRQRVLSQPYGRLQRYYLFQNTFVDHPYQRSGIGTVADLDAASLEDARAFHENFYRPDNATLVVSGNFDPAQLDRWIDEHLGSIPRPSRPILRHQLAGRPHSAARTITAYGPNVPLPAVVHSWQRPKADHPDSAALEVLSRILSSGQSSRLYRTLVYDRQLAQSAGAINYGLEDSGLFAINAIVASGKDPAEVEAAIDAEVARVRNERVSDAELREAITEYVSDELFDRETPTGRAETLAQGVINAGDPRWSDAMLAAVQRVTAADVQRVARQYLSADRRVALRYLDEGQRQGEAQPDPSQQPTNVALGLNLPAAVGTPNQLAPEGERVAPPAPGPQRAIAAPAFAERRLANGMRVVVAKSTELPLAGAYLVFGGGSSADPAERPGVAAMMTNLADSGTSRLTATQLAAEIERLGAQIGTSAGADSSTAFVAAPAANIEAAGRLLSEVVRSPAFAQEELDRERRRSLDQLRVALRQPGTVNAFALRRVLFGDAPYGALSPTPASLEALTRDDLVRYHANWWRPDNATMVIIGSLDAEQGFALAERLFGDWAAPAQPLPELPANRAGTALAPRVVVVDMPAADQAAVSVALRGVTRADSDYYPLVLANSALGGSSTARLFQEVRVNRALSYGAYSSLETMRDEGLLVAQAQTRNDAVPEVAQVMLGEIRRLAAEPIAPDQLERRRTLLTGSFGRQVETTFGLGGFLTNLAVQGLPMSEYGRYLSSLAAVTPEQIARSVAAELDPAQASVVVAGRASQFIGQLRAQYPNVEVIPADQFDFGGASLRSAEN
ncbi:pitrilysin family protein [Sphingosinicella sp. YJ22]|uniref:M16 family metallopeptidase n=1 Tax=Sphingosinicella sp. YJ22 TaxID=1104780 RepID=UPI0014080A94|nr:pitrilysin family protein [Sphingosinicella sp. YJ22]